MSADGYRALRESAAWLDLSERGKIQLTGEDRARLLHAMTTNHIQQLTPGTGCYAYFLSAQGRILADVNVLCWPEALLLDTEPETREKIFQHLDKFIIADDVVLEDLTPVLSTIAIEGPESAEVLRKLGAPVPASEYASEAWGNRWVARLSFTGSTGFFVLLPAADKAAFTQELEAGGTIAANPEDAETVRLEHGKPRYGQDLTERFLAQEANLPHAVHFSKGCYLGQEIVERVRSRGQVHRLLLPIQIEGSAPPPAGTKAEGTLAEITSAAYSPALGKVAALAYVRGDKTKPGSELSFEGRNATVTGYDVAGRS